MRLSTIHIHINYLVCIYSRKYECISSYTRKYVHHIFISKMENGIDRFSEIHTYIVQLQSIKHCCHSSAIIPHQTEKQKKLNSTILIMYLIALQNAKYYVNWSVVYLCPMRCTHTHTHRTCTQYTYALVQIGEQEQQQPHDLNACVCVGEKLRVDA